jgi:hypothetical protein
MRPTCKSHMMRPDRTDDQKICKNRNKSRKQEVIMFDHPQPPIAAPSLKHESKKRSNLSRKTDGNTKNKKKNENRTPLLAMQFHAPHKNCIVPQNLVLMRVCRCCALRSCSDAYCSIMIRKAPRYERCTKCKCDQINPHYSMPE